MRWLVLVVVSCLAGCVGELARGPVYTGVEGGYICGLLDDRIDLQRLSFNVPSMFMGKPCSRFADYSSHKPGDWFSVGGNLQRRDGGSVYADIFSVGFKVVGGLTKTDFEHYLPPEDFVNLKWDYSADKVGPMLREVVWLDRLGKTCAKFNYLSGNYFVHRRTVEYWCWDYASGIQVPFMIWASEVISPGETWQVDLEKTIFEPVFSSLQFNTLTEEYKQGIRDERTALCGRHIKSYTERGIGWLTGETVEPKWTPVFLEMCGYDPAKTPKKLEARPRRHSIQAPVSVVNY